MTSKAKQHRTALPNPFGGMGKTVDQVRQSEPSAAQLGHPPSSWTRGLVDLWLAPETMIMVIDLEPMPRP